MASGSRLEWLGIAQCLIQVETLCADAFDEANKRNLCGNRSIPAEHYWTENWYICKKSNCPAVLTENLFQDNKEDVMFLETEQGKQAITNLHFDAIVSYINTYDR